MAHAQAAGGLSVQVGEDQSVSTSRPTRPLVEPHLATNPRNPEHLVGAAMVAVTDVANLSQTRCIAVASFDAGRTWVTHEFDFQGCHDPWVVILDDGAAIFVGLENRDRRIVHLWLYRSPDGGRTWSTPPHSFGPDHDHPTLAVDRSEGRFLGALYVTSLRAVRDGEGRPQSNAFVARSMDGGITFVDVAEHHVMNLAYNPATAAVLPSGTLLIPLSGHDRYVADARSIVPLKNSLFWVVRSDDGGAHFSIPMLVSDGCRGGFPAIAVDSSNGSKRSRVFAVCREGNRGPFIMRSDDGGNLWSDPVHVPKTLPAAETGQPGALSIAVNREGILAVTWHERGPDPASKCWNVLAAFSTDGESFTEAQKVSTKPSCPTMGSNGWSATRWPLGGDYSGLAAAADGTFHLLWADGRGDYYQLHTAQVRVTR